mgnify:CR=1|jgi:hypothetical protein
MGVLSTYSTARPSRRIHESLPKEGILKAWMYLPWMRTSETCSMDGFQIESHCITGKGWANGASVKVIRDGHRFSAAEEQVYAERVG